MSSTFTSPLRINKRNNPTNNGVIAPSNTGAVVCTQQQFFAPISAPKAAGTLPTFKIGETVATPLVIPAGSNIVGLLMLETAAPSVLLGGAIEVSIAITNPTTGVVTTTLLGSFSTTTTGGILPFNIIFDPAKTVLWQNVGPLDATIVISNTAITALTGTLAATIQVDYTPRNADGSITAYGANLTNQ
jgi:hypothetical protein